MRTPCTSLVSVLVLVACGGQTGLDGSSLDATGDTTVVDTRVQDTSSPPDVSVDPGPETTDDPVGEDVYMEDVVWQECDPPAELDTSIHGPGGPDHTEVSIDATGTISAISVDYDGRWTLEVDFTGSDPDLGTVSFTLPPGAGDRTGLAAHDEIQVIYHSYMWFWTIRCMTIVRDGTTLLAAATNDASCAPIDELSSFQVDDLTFTSGTSDCHPREDDCATWRRLFLDVTCDDLSEPVRILDGSEADVACGPGYHVALRIHTAYHREVDYCTDQPMGLFSILVTPD